MEEFNKLKLMVQSLLVEEFPTESVIRKVIADVRPVCPDVTDVEAENLALELETIHGVTMTDGAALQDPGFEPWLDGSRSEIDHY